MITKARAMVMASFAADALALGGHWVYNTQVLAKKFGRLERLEAPLAKNYHGAKAAGDFTHYGDQTLVLLESIAAEGGFELSAFAEDWRAFMKTYDGYVDRATEGTLANFEAGAGPQASGSASTDLAGAVRIAPLVYRHRDDLDALVAAARAQTAMTHNHPLVVAAAEFLARTAWAVLGGSAPVAAMQQAAAALEGAVELGQWLKAGGDSRSRETAEAIADFGQACEIEMAFPAMVHLVARYENDLKSALVENVMAGGDSAGRGMAVGLILGAWLGEAAIPGDWIDGLRQAEKITGLLAALDPKG
ncbi:MAG TPA: ADP-ribosylglycohydrolase family protein [Desulfobacterales bacterium]|nr:ADP-ribosylglycohydrolase family protein [Desulfobacterales bacterium]